MTDSDLAVLRRRPHELTDAMVRATADCLEHEGLDGSLYVSFHERSMRQLAGAYHSDPVYYSGLLPPLTPEAAATTGYRTVLRPHTFNESDISALPDAYSPGLFGDGSQFVELDIPGFGVVGASASGCVASAAASLFGSVGDWLLADQFAVSGIRQFADEALASEDVLSVAEAYEACMRDAGYDVANPAQAAQLARDTWVPSGTETEAPSQDEIDMAVADAKCQVAHPVLRLAEQKTLDLASEWIADNSAAIIAASAAQRRALDRVLGAEWTD